MILGRSHDNNSVTDPESNQFKPEPVRRGSEKDFFNEVNSIEQALYVFQHPERFDNWGKMVGVELAICN